MSWSRKFIFLLLSLFSVHIYGQNFTVSGTIKDADTKEPLIGATLKVKNESKGAISDVNGKYSISGISLGDEIQVIFIGYETYSFKVSQEVHNILLKPKSNSINDVVVVGYSSKKKSDISGAITTIDSNRLKRKNFVNVTDALQGETPGAVIVTAPRPGGGSTTRGTSGGIRLRGYSSMSVNDPLILVDGNRISDFNLINPNDIETMTVIKDAATAAQYGNRGANGVIVITTKSGSSGKPKITYNTWMGWQNPTKKIDMLNLEEYMMLRREAEQNAGLAIISDDMVNAAQGQQGTDWQNEVLTTAFMQSHDIGISAGNNKIKSFTSLGYLGQDGIFRNADYKRYNVRSNLEIQATKKLKVGQNLQMNYGIQNTTGDFYLSRMFMLPPYAPVTFDDGSWGYDTLDPSTIGIKKNPYAMTELIEWENRNFHINGQFYGEYKFNEKWSVKSAFRYDIKLDEKNYWEPEYQIGTYIQNAFADLQDVKERNWINENFLNYKTTIYTNHNINLMLGSFAYQHKKTWFGAKGFGFPSNDVNILDVANENLDIWGSNTGYADLSGFATFAYNFKNKYYLDGVLRRDGSSRFAKDHRWGNFWGIKGLWNISRENFYKKLRPYIQNLRVRAGYGLVGNANSIADFEYHTVVTANKNYILDGQSNVGVAPSDLANSVITWETIKETNLGLDFNLFHNKVSVSAEYYIKNTVDALVDVPMPANSGFSGTVKQNLGKIQNKGFETSVNYKLNFKEGSFSSGFNYTFLQNEVQDFPYIIRGGRDGQGFITTNGASIRSIYGYKAIGVFQNQQELENYPHFPKAEPGDLKFEDINGDGVIDANDRTMLGSSIPKHLLGFNINVNWKGFDLVALVNGSYGNSIMLANANFGGGRGFFDFNENLVAERMERWHGEGTSNTHPRLYWGASPGNNNINSSFFVQDASFTRLKNVQLGYTISSNVLSHINIQNLRIYIGGTNLATWTKYTGYDPEILSEVSDSYGWDWPQARTIIFGLNANF